MSHQVLTVLLIGIAVAIVVFLVTREFWTWYWKINQYGGPRNLDNAVRMRWNGERRFSHHGTTANEVE